MKNRSHLAAALLPVLALAAAPVPAGAQVAPPAEVVAPSAEVGTETPRLSPAAPLPRPATEGETETEIEARAQPEPEQAAPAPMPRPGELAPPRRSRPAAGWTLREVPGGTTLALARGPGLVFSVSVFCLGGRPWLALELEPAPDQPEVRADFGFSGARVEAEALREDGAGGAFVVELAEGPLAGLLSGADSAVSLGIDGTQQGPLSLSGSTRAIRAALADCHAF